MNWIQVTCQRLQLLAMDQVMRSMVQGTAQILGKTYPHYKKVGIRGYISEELHEEYLEYLKNKPLPFFEKAFRKMHQHCEEVLSWFEELSTRDWSSLDEKKAKATLQEIDHTLSLLGGTFVTPLLLEELFEKKLTKILSRLPEEKKNQCKQALSIPNKLGYSGVMERELLELCLHIPSEREVINFTKKWGWLNFKFYFGKPYSSREIKTRLVAIAAAKERLATLRLEEEQQAKKFQEVLNQLNPTTEERKIITLLRENMYFRTYRLDATARIGFYLLPFFKALAKLRGIRLEEVGLYRMGELINNSLNTEELKKRKLGWILTMLHGKIEIFTGKVKEEKENLNAQEIHGVIVYRGIVQGPAKIILEKKDLVKVNEGDIIIAEMTYPDYNLALAKAKAIVTNIGGITCHAAIVSRELNKPCIIGTKIATKVFKDEDLVEVDAEKGVVRKV